MAQREHCFSCILLYWMLEDIPDTTIKLEWINNIQAKVRPEST